MKLNKKCFLLYAVTDRKWSGYNKHNLYDQIELALKGGVTCVQLREKNLSDSEFLAEALEVSRLCKKYNVPLFINDNIKIAVECGADGVHLGQNDTPILKARQILGENKMIGISVSSERQAKNAVKDGADYLGVGAMFFTDTKKDVTIVSKKILCDIRNAVNIPIVVIGGIKKSNILEFVGTGINGIALVSAIFSAKNIESECCLLRQMAEKIVR